MSSFFTLPASQRKRKRPPPQQKSSDPTRQKRKDDDDEISGSDISEDEGRTKVVDEGFSDEDEDEYADEDVASKRIRLAEQYLANTQKEVLEQDGFDAADVDQENLRRRMGERLKQDTAESKGKLYKWIADDLDWRGAKAQVLRPGHAIKSVTGVAMQGRYVYGVSKDFQLVKWEAPDTMQDARKRQSKKWKVVKTSYGKRKEKKAMCHNAAILCVAASEDGKFVVTGGADDKLVVWDAASLEPLRAFTHHRDSVLALAFRKGTNQLYSASKDRSVKTWSLNELAYVETLFGHGDDVADVSALAEEICISVGSRDRTARLWKVVEEQQMLFRGGGSGTSKVLDGLRRAYEDDSGVDPPRNDAYHEGSMDQVAMVDNDMFVTASDNGSMSLWNVNKKKAIFTLPLAHGTDPPVPLAEASAEEHPNEELDEMSRGGRHARWITALAAVPFSNVLVTGSWDGYVRAWRISQDKRRIEPLGALGVHHPEEEDAMADSDTTMTASGDLSAVQNGAHQDVNIRGIINDLAIMETGPRGKKTVLVAAAVGKEHRLGRWKAFEDGMNTVILYQVPRVALLNGSAADEVDDELEGKPTVVEDEFEGFG